MTTILRQRWVSLAPGMLLVAILASGPRAQAQPITQFPRTWVSGVGDDANPCSRTAPCKTFAGAIAVTQPGGEIDALDPGGFGNVRITQAVTLDGTSNLASVLGQGAGITGITINAGPNDDVVLRGLSLDGARSGLTGIRFNSGRDLHVEQVAIVGFHNGIDFEPTGDSDLVVRDSDIQDNTLIGILSTSSGGNAHVTIDNTRIANGAIGVSARSNSRVSISDSVFTGLASFGLLAQPDAGTAEVNVVNSMIVLGRGVGIRASGQATVRISRVTLEGNASGIEAGAGGVVYTYFDNQNTDNAANGEPNAPATPTPTAAPTATPTATPMPLSCNPRPNVGLKVWPVSPGRLQVSVTANEGVATGNNALKALRFTSTDNANVDVRSITGGTGSFTVPLASGTLQQTFFVNRIDGALATTVNVIVQDKCGDWPTSVGGGPTAF